MLEKGLKVVSLFEKKELKVVSSV